MNFYREIDPFGNTNASAPLGRNKGVVLTNTQTTGNTADLCIFRANGTTAFTRVLVTSGKTEIFPFQIWGISLGAGWTGGTLS
jgi:hypothetical protein